MVTQAHGCPQGLSLLSLALVLSPLMLAFRALPLQAWVTPLLPLLYCPRALLLRWGFVLFPGHRGGNRRLTAGRVTKGNKPNSNPDVTENLPHKIQVMSSSVLWQTEVLPKILANSGHVFSCHSLSCLLVAFCERCLGPDSVKLNDFGVGGMKPQQ